MELSEQKLREAIKNGIKTINEKVSDKVHYQNVLDALEGHENWDDSRLDAIEIFIENLPREYDATENQISSVLDKAMGLRYENLEDFAVNALSKDLKTAAKGLSKYYKPVKENLEVNKSLVTEAESNFKTLLGTSEDESIGRKIRLGGKRDPGQEVWQKVDKKNWMNLKTKKKLDLNKWAKHADEFHMSGKDLQFESKVNEAGDTKKYKQFWDKGPETQIRRRFGKEYNNAIENRVSLLLALVEDPDKAEDYAEMDFLSLPDDIATQLVNMDPKELHRLLDESVIKELVNGGDHYKVGDEITFRLKGEAISGRIEKIKNNKKDPASSKLTVRHQKGYNGPSKRYYTDTIYADQIVVSDNYAKWSIDESVNEGISKSAIKKLIKTIDKQIDTETGGDGEALDNETLQELEQEKERLESMIESTLIDDWEEAMHYAQNESVVTESVIGIKTERDFKGKDLITALDKAKIKYKMNRLSMTLSVLDLDKKYYDDAKKVVDDLGLTVMMAKESKLYEASIELDTIDPESKDLAKLLKKNNVKIDIITMNGPGGGNPLVKLIGKRKDLEKVIADSKYGWDDPELEEFIEESKLNEKVNGKNLYKKIKKDKKTEMYSDLIDANDVDIEFYHKDVNNGKSKIYIEAWSGRFIIWSEKSNVSRPIRVFNAENVKNMKDIDKQIKLYQDNGSNVNEHCNQVNRNK